MSYDTVESDRNESGNKTGGTTYNKGSDSNQGCCDYVVRVLNIQATRKLHISAITAQKLHFNFSAMLQLVGSLCAVEITKATFWWK